MVQKKRSECPVYEVQPETGQGGVRVLHHNMFLLCEFLPVEQTTATLRKMVKGKHSKSNSEQQARENSSEGIDRILQTFQTWPAERAAAV